MFWWEVQNADDNWLTNWWAGVWGRSIYEVVYNLRFAKLHFNFLRFTQPIHDKYLWSTKWKIDQEPSIWGDRGWEFAHISIGSQRIQIKFGRSVSYSLKLDNWPKSWTTTREWTAKWSLKFLTLKPWEISKSWIKYTLTEIFFFVRKYF